MKALPQRAREKYVTRAVVQTQSVHVKRKMERGTQRDQH